MNPKKSVFIQRALKKSQKKRRKSFVKTPCESSKLSSTDSLDKLCYVGPYLTQQLAKVGLHTWGDLQRVVEQEGTTRQDVTRLLRRGLPNQRGGECLGKETRRHNRSGRKIGNSYRVRKNNRYALEAFRQQLKMHYVGTEFSRKIPIQTRERLGRTAYPSQCSTWKR